MKTLISMTDFVLQFDKPAGYFECQNDFLLCQVDYMGKVINYANFLKKTLTLGMFVPCDENGNVLTKDKLSDFVCEDDCFCKNCNDEAIEVLKYQEAKEKVLFKGFQLMKDSHFKTIVFNKDKDIQFSINISLQSNIENIISSKLELTESALKQINL